MTGKVILVAATWLLVLSGSSASPNCPQIDGDNGSIFIPHETDCGKFHQCSNGEAILHECPPGLHFDPNENVCDFPFNVDCIGAGKQWKPSQSKIAAAYAYLGKAKSPSSAPHCPEYGPGAMATYYPHATDCAKFYQCTNAGPALFDCPAGLHFNPKINVCDWPANVSCQQGSQALPDVISPPDSHIWP